ncbi:MAG: FHA domain-containing protein [Pirellulales bacterium]|nr:FHA domain-containing protein [Pirellulales bacterium]
MELTLKVLTGKYSGQVIKVHHEKFLIGRGEQCHLRPHSDAISRQHCALSQRGADVIVEDLGSRNGTIVNGEKITGPTVIHSGDQLIIGQLVFEVVMPLVRKTSAPTGDTVSSTAKVDTTSMKPAAAPPASPPAQGVPATKPVAVDPAPGIAASAVPKPAQPLKPAEPGLAAAKLPKVRSIDDVAQRVTAKKGDPEDQDISDWLMADDLESLTDTRTIQITSTQQMELLNAADDTVNETGNMSDSKAANKKEKVYGKLPPVPKPANAAKDSREAAAEALRKMMKNR